MGQNETEESVGDDGKVAFKTKIARNVYRVLFENNLPKSNDLFMPNRMAYIVDLNDDETDVPITSIRSKAECINNEVCFSVFGNFLFTFFNFLGKCHFNY